MGKPQVTLTLAGDAKDLIKAGKDAEKSIEGVGKKSQESGKEAKKGFDTGTFAAVALADAVSNAGDTIDSVQAAFRIGAEQAKRMARAQLDVEQASADVRQAQLDQKQSTLDLEQAHGDLRQSYRDLEQAQLDVEQSTRDVGQAQLDVKQATLDVETAQNAYSEAVQKFGKDSTEARQALLDLEQANLDVKQAQGDVTQAQQDGKQAQEDASQAARDGTQAQQDLKQAQEDLNQAQIDAQGALLDLKDAQQEASDASGWRGWLDVVGNVAPGLVAIAVGIGPVVEGFKALATTIAVSVVPSVWAFTTALLANPITWVIAGIAALVGAFIWLWQNVEGFRNFFKVAWDFIARNFQEKVDWIKGAISSVGGFFQGLWDGVANMAKVAGGIIEKSFKGTVNAIISVLNGAISAVNAVIRGINWATDWVGIPAIPEIPKIPKLHTGGVVPGMPGQEVLTVLQAGERVSTSSQGGGAGHLVVSGDGDSKLAAFLMGLEREGILRWRGA